MPGDDDLGDVVDRRDLEHDRPEHVLEDRPEAAGAGLARDGEVGDRLSASSSNSSSAPSSWNMRWYCFTKAFLGP
jgi:hypothetical protein